ncbi:hypothetical protein, partial [Stenotrophomonas maltophilia group sp. RNC7]|uniref:hypothetical protein n=1 Tax=Stenotrophomonas maltophilia group sp. RNC7 TaxID=3071467 RepID=UPI0027DEDBEC
MTHLQVALDEVIPVDLRGEMQAVLNVYAANVGSSIIDCAVSVGLVEVTTRSVASIQVSGLWRYGYVLAATAAAV